jgi:hypothetical protein
MMDAQQGLYLAARDESEIQGAGLPGLNGPNDPAASARQSKGFELGREGF